MSSADDLLALEKRIAAALAVLKAGEAFSPDARIGIALSFLEDQRSISNDQARILILNGQVTDLERERDLANRRYKLQLHSAECAERGAQMADRERDAALRERDAALAESRDLIAQRDTALGQCKALVQQLRDAGAEIGQMAIGWHADKEGREQLTTRVAELEHIAEEAAGLLADALRNLPGEQTVQQAGTRRDIQRWLASRGKATP